jgi:hypothetical protein
MMILLYNTEKTSIQNPKDLKERKAHKITIQNPKDLNEPKPMKILMAEKLLRVGLPFFYVAFVLIFFAFGMYYYYTWARDKENNR